MTARVCFASSPTGPLRVGSARMALLKFLFARRCGGTMILRLDELDTDTAKPDLQHTILKDLRWLGITWDELARQSRQSDRYSRAAERLRRADRLYPCFENEAELRVKREQRLKRGLSPVYDRAMRSLTPQQRAAAEANGKRPCWRFLLSHESIVWNDTVRGPITVKPGTLSDPVLMRADSTPTPLFASVVDDLESDITHVIATTDNINRTAAALDIRAALGAAPDALSISHISVVNGPDRGNWRSVNGLRQDGVEASALVAFLARLGTPHPHGSADLGTLLAEFDLTSIIEEAGFDVTPLLAINKHALTQLPFDAVSDRLPNGATEAFWLAVRGRLELLSEARGWWDVVAGMIVPPVIEGEQELLRTALELLPPEPWDEQIWAVWTRSVAAATGRTPRSLSLPLRLALTGEEQGPDPGDLLPLMGRARAANRLQIAA